MGTKDNKETIYLTEKDVVYPVKVKVGVKSFWIIGQKKETMRNREEIEKFLKDLQLNPNYHVFNFNEGFQYDLEDIIQRALDHFKPKPVTSQEKLKEIREMIKYILPTPDCNDSEIVETYTETIMSIFSQDKRVISNSEIEKESILTKNTGWSLENQKIWKNGAKWMRSKLSTTVTEPKE